MATTVEAPEAPPNRFQLTAEYAEQVRRNPPENMTVPECAAWLTISLTAMWQLVLNKKIKSSRINGVRRCIRLQDARDYRDRRTT